VFAILPHFVIQSELRVFALAGIRPSMPRLDPVAALGALYDAVRAARDAHDELAQDDPARVLPAIERACREALALEDEDESSLRLTCLAELLGELTGPRVVDLLIDILGCPEADPRRAAGEALSGLAFDRFKDVATGVERALARLPEGNPALAELPYLLAEIPEPGVMRLLAQFLAHRDPDAVASAIEALVEVGDPSALPLLEPLAGDARRVELEDEGGTEGDASIGELVSEARALLTRGAPS
jgi:HEAT repeat protein